MKAKELRLGNYVSGRFGALTIITELKMLANDSDEESMNIPITEEWLRDFGFKNDFGKHWTKSIGKDYSEGQLIISYNFSREDEKSFQVSQGTGGDNCTWIYPQKPKYVHELQNLYYALTKQELELAVTAKNEK